MPPVADNTAELKKLLEENLAVAKDNNRLLRELRRNAIIGFVAKAILWLILLGVPLFFLSAYITPLMNAFTGQSGQALPSGVFGIPSEEQINTLIQQYQAGYQE